MERAHSRRWANKTSWRLTFVVWTIVLVVWAVVTILIDYDTLVFIRRLSGEHGRAPILVLATVIVAPMLVDAARNALRYRHVWRDRTRHDAQTAQWRSEVPATTPRRFRDPDLEAASQLTWRERAIVEQGQRAHGTVHHHGELSSVRYEAPWGDTIASRPVTSATPRAREGAPAPLLFEPGAHVGVAPTLLGLEFLSAPTHDVRPQLEPKSDTPPTSPLRTSVVATLHPVERMSRYCTVEVGELELDEGHLTLTPAAGDPITIRLDKPFRVEATAFLLEGERAELNLRIEPRTHTAYRAGEHVPLEVKTELPQARVDRRLPEGWIDACYIAPADFDVLWRALVAAADDSSLTTAVSLG